MSLTAEWPTPYGHDGMTCDTCGAGAAFASDCLNAIARRSVPGVPLAAPSDGWHSGWPLPSGWEASMVWLDAHGQSMRLVHRCPDCTP